MRMGSWIKAFMSVQCVWLSAMARADTREADALFVQGKFADALAAYEAVPADSPSAPAALRRQGTIHLMANRLNEAEAKLKAVLDRDPADKKAAASMAEVESRRGNFAEAARWLNVAGRPDRAAAFALFGTDRPYRIASAVTHTTVGFEHTDPLPALHAEANGKEGLFILDTGAAETILDPAFAQAIAVPTAGSEQGTFAGGKTASVAYGRLSRFKIADLDIRDLPVALISTAKFAAAANGKPVAGVIGTSLLQRFHATIDYPGGKLTLATAEVATTSRRAPIASIPFWMAGDHFLLAEGRLNDGAAQMFFIDTGLAGFAFTAPEATLKNAGIGVPMPKPEKDGGIGTAAVAPFEIKSLSLGTLRRQNLEGLYGAFPPPLEMALGTRIGGIVSHGFFRPYAITLDFKRMILEVRGE